MELSTKYRAALALIAVGVALGLLLYLGVKQSSSSEVETVAPFPGPAKSDELRDELAEVIEIERETVPSSTVAPPPGQDLVVRDFLLSVEHGPEVLAMLEGDGVDLTQLGVPPPFDEVRETFIDALVWDEGAWQQAVSQEMSWVEGGLDADVLREIYRLDSGLELAPWQMEEFTTEAEQRNAEVRPLVDEYLAAMEDRFVQAAREERWEKYPYQTLPGRKAWEPGPRIYSARALGHSGWAVRIMLLQDEHTDLVALQQRHLEIVRERERFLKELIVGYEKELGGY